MYIVAFIAMLGCVCLEAASQYKDKFVFNDTDDTVVLYTIVGTKYRGKTDETIVKPKTITNLNRVFWANKLYIGKGEIPGNHLSSYYCSKDSDVVKSINSKEKASVIIVEADPIKTSDLKAHTISKEEFDKKYPEASVVRAQECPTFSVLPGVSALEEKKKAAALNPDELAG